MVAKTKSAADLFRDGIAASQADFDKLDPADQRRAHKWMPVSHRRIGLRRYRTSKAWLAAAKADLKPRAVDWDSVLEFLNGLLPLVEAIIAMFTKV